MDKFWVIALIVVVAIGGLGLLFTGNNQVGTFLQSVFTTPQNALASSFTPVYCNDPTSVCCVKTLSQPAETINYNVYGSCPTTASGKCVLSNVQSQAGKTSVTLYVGSTNCRIVQKIIPIAQVYQCDDQYAVTVAVGNTNVEVPRGYYYFTDVYSGKATVTRDTYGEKLITNLGAPVQPSCSYSPPTGTKLTTAGLGNLGVSYTVPVGSAVGTSDSCILTWNAGNRHICGNLEEKCDADSDCIGHTYGNKECYQRTLQTYGCTQLGTPSGLTNGFLGQDTGVIFAPLGTTGAGQTSNNFGVTSRCEIKSATAVQCCGDTDCGSSMVCDTTTFTCKAPEKVGCTADYKCGVSTQCDYATKELKTPKCTIVGNTGTCGFTTKSVGCCVDGNCADTQSCDLGSHTCKDKVPVKELCPFGCCNGDTLYIDKPCSAGSFCVNHVCSVEPQCSATKPCGTNLECKDGVCKPVSEVCVSSVGGLVERHIGTKEDCNFWCSVGLKSPEKINVCVTDYTPLTLVIITVLALATILMVGLTRGKGGKKSTSKSSGNAGKVLKSKTFWKFFIAIAIIVLIIIFRAFLVWFIIGAVVLFLVDFFLLRSKIFRGIKNMFKK